MRRVVLSICIPLHNRSEVAISHIEKILKVNDSRYNIVVSDSSDDGLDLNSIWRKTDSRVKIYRVSSKLPAISNWKKVLDFADGIFAFHLNDRDILVEDKLQELLDFLEKRKDYSGGICKYISTSTEHFEFKDNISALMNVPFFSSHVTGIIFNTERYKAIENLDYIFSNACGIHPHDIVLGYLAQKGKMFIYTSEIWNYASPEFYKKNQSGVSSKKMGLFFTPENRLFELKQSVKMLNKLEFSEKVKSCKTDQMIKTYLELSTNGYFYFLESDHETAHYGIEREKFGLIRRYKFSIYVIDLYVKELGISKEQKRRYKRWLTKSIVIPVIAKYTSKIKNQKLRNLLKRMRLKRGAVDNAYLR